MTGFLHPKNWLRGLIRATLRARPVVRLFEWLDGNVIIPEESGSPNPGKLRTARFAPFRGLYDLAQQRGVHFFTFCASARIGKTLFSICILLYWIAERFGHVVWLDPTRTSARKFVRAELEAFLMQCAPVRALAVITKTAWTTLEKTFRGKLFRLVASGAEADLHGFQAELAIINELDRCRHSTDKDAASEDKIIARTRQFADSRLILRNSTPGEGGEFSPIWQHLLRGSQHYCYVPCPHCTAAKNAKAGKARVIGPNGRPQSGWSQMSYEPGLAGWQRLSFFAEKKLVPFDQNLNPLVGADGKLPPRKEWREEVTGQIKFDQFAIYEDRPSQADPTQFEKVKAGYDVDAVERGATYECAHCKRELEWVDLRWMLPRYRWVSHNPSAPRDHISAHLSALYSPFERWGIIAKEFIEACGNLGSLIKFWNFTLGLPFIRSSAAVKEEDIDRVIARTPHAYIQGQLPLEPELLTITIDVQGAQMWWVIRAWGVVWDHPDWPTWSALVDWGEAVSWPQILEICGLAERADGTTRTFTFTRPDGTISEFVVTAGFVDFGFEAYENKNVAEFCLANSAVFSPMKGTDPAKLRGNVMRTTPVFDDQLELILFWSDYFTADLYYTCIKEGFTVSADGQKPVLWWLPRTLDKHYREQLTSERQVEENGRRVWKAFGPNHLGDCEKEQRAISGTVESRMDDVRAERRKELEAAAKAA